MFPADNAVLHGRPDAAVGFTCVRARCRTKIGTWRSLVSALVWGTKGRGFESRRPDRSRVLL
jgi:hypothetical protein